MAAIKWHTDDPRFMLLQAMEILDNEVLGLAHVGNEIVGEALEFVENAGLMTWPHYAQLRAQYFLDTQETEHDAID